MVNIVRDIILIYAVGNQYILGVLIFTTILNFCASIDNVVRD